jgi:hypothetical protein
MDGDTVVIAVLTVKNLRADDVFRLLDLAAIHRGAGHENNAGCRR